MYYEMPMPPFEAQDVALREFEQRIIETRDFVQKRVRVACADMVGRPCDSVLLDQLRTLLQWILLDAAHLSGLQVMKEFDWDVSFDQATLAMKVQMRPLTEHAREWLEDKQNRGLW